LVLIFIIILLFFGLDRNDIKEYLPGAYSKVLECLPVKGYFVAVHVPLMSLQGHAPFECKRSSKERPCGGSADEPSIFIGNYKN